MDIKINSIYLTEIYKIYINNTSNNFINILNIAFSIWNDIYLYYLNKCNDCYLNIRSKSYNDNLNIINSYKNIKSILFHSKELNSELFNNNNFYNSDINNLLNENLELNNLNNSDDLINEINNKSFNTENELIDEVTNEIIENNINKESIDNYQRKNLLELYMSEEYIEPELKIDNDINKIMNLNNELLNTIIEKNDETYILMFNYINVESNIVNGESKEIFKLDNTFLPQNGYPEILMKSGNKKFEYLLKDTDKINIIGWYINDKYILNVQDINNINYNNNIQININFNLYIYVLYELI